MRSSKAAKTMTGVTVGWHVGKGGDESRDNLEGSKIHLDIKKILEQCKLDKNVNKVKSLRYH